MDLRVTHEEADVIIVNQVVKIAQEHCTSIHVVYDDTDVFVLLIHFYASQDIYTNIYMVPTNTTRSAVDIGATARQHHDIVQYLLPLHALTGCDTVSTIYGIGKKKALNVLKQGIYPPLLGDFEANFDELEATAVKFIARCYGSRNVGSMSEVRLCVWQHKTSKGKSQKFRLPVLPPTSSAFQLHIKRAHFQACLWMSALQADPPTWDSTDYGWMDDRANEILLPVSLPTGTLAAPEQVLNLLCCSCTSTDACSSRRCTCNKSDIACTIFCKCKMNDSVNITCMNPLNSTVEEISDDESDHDESDDD